MPTATYLVFTNCTDPARDEEFNRWYTHTHVPDLSAWVFRDPDGLYAISLICTHLGCIVARDDRGAFKCPCHGSKFAANGKVSRGPAPKGLNWLAMSMSPDGQLVVDKVKTVIAGTRFQA